MKTTICHGEAAFTRTQWLLIVCLSVLAFDLGIRYAEREEAERKERANRKIVRTNVVVSPAPIITNIVTEEPPPVPQTNVVRVYPAPRTNAPYPERKPVSPPEKADLSQMTSGYPPQERKVPRPTNTWPRFTNSAAADPNNPGIRVLLP